MLEEAGLLSKARPMAEDLPAVPGKREGEEDIADEAEEASKFGADLED
jgi:hypothetical protein